MTSNAIRPTSPTFNPADSMAPPFSRSPSERVPPGSKGLSTSMSSNPTLASESDPRLRVKIAGGLFVPYSKGRAWLKKKRNGRDIPDDHSADLTIAMHLVDAILERGYSNDVQYAQTRNATGLDLLVVTQWRRGEFLNTGPEGEEEILQDDLKDLLKPEKEDEEARKVLSREFGIDADYKRFFLLP